MRPLTKTEFSKERKVSRARVYQWVDDGRVVVLEDGRVDADASNALLDASLDQAKGIRRDGNITSTSSVPEAPAPGVQPELLPKPADKPDSANAARDDKSYWADKAREQKAVASLAEMKMLKEAGALVPSAGVRKAESEAARGIRNRMLAIPDRTAPVLASMTNPTQIHKYLTDEIQKALREFCAELEQRAAAAAGADEREPALL
jgi:hypothetical protein